MANTDARHRELAYRASDGVEVVPWWHQIGNEPTAGVSDERNGAYLELTAEPDDALDVFNHRYAYAAFRGLPDAGGQPPAGETRSARRGG